MAISRFAASRLTQGLPKYQSAWDQDNVEQGALVPIAQVVSAGGSASMVFSSVPQNYRDLKIIIQGRAVYGSYTTLSVYFNSTGFNGWSQTYVRGQNTTVSSARGTTSTPTYGFLMDTGWNNTAAGVFSSSEVDVFNYSSTSTYKTAIARNSLEEGTTGTTELNAGTWANNAAITYIDVATNGLWAGGSTATLYGIKAGV